MNYQAGANLTYSAHPSGIPIEDAWNRVNYGLAGYGLLVGGSISDPVPAEATISSEATATLTISLRGD
jgi:hypothetical protein